MEGSVGEVWEIKPEKTRLTWVGGTERESESG